jgi:hypothetical protein
MGGTPGWAGGGPDHNLAPTNIGDWRDFVIALVSRYRPDPTADYPCYYCYYWGVGNEPDNTDNWPKNHDKYNSIVVNADAALQIGNPNAFLVGPEPGEGGVYDGWYASTMADVGQYFDVVSVHWYGDSSGVPLDFFMDHWVQPRSQGKPVWLTEVGQTACAGDPSSEASQADYYENAILRYLERRSWWTMIFFYHLMGGGAPACEASIVGPDNIYNKQAFGRYQSYIFAP